MLPTQLHSTHPRSYSWAKYPHLVMPDIPGNINSTWYPPMGQSDHAVAITDFELTPHRDRSTTRAVWRYQHADWDRLRAFYRDTDWTEIITDEPDTSCSLVTQRIIKGMTRFIPSRVLKMKPTDPVWWIPSASLVSLPNAMHGDNSLQPGQPCTTGAISPRPRGLIDLPF